MTAFPMIKNNAAYEGEGIVPVRSQSRTAILAQDNGETNKSHLPRLIQPRNMENMVMAIKTPDMAIPVIFEKKTVQKILTIPRKTMVSHIKRTLKIRAETGVSLLITDRLKP